MASLPEIIITIINIIVTLPQSLLAIIKVARLYCNTSDPDPESGVPLQYRKIAQSGTSQYLFDQSSLPKQAPHSIQSSRATLGKTALPQDQMQTLSLEMSSCKTSSTCPGVTPATVPFPLPTHHSVELRCLCSRSRVYPCLLSEDGATNIRTAAAMNPHRRRFQEH